MFSKRNASTKKAHEEQSSPTRFRFIKTFAVEIGIFGTVVAVLLGVAAIIVGAVKKLSK